MNTPKDRQASFNASSRPLRDAFADHRAEVMSLLGTQRGRICVLGAGNGNDLDLLALLAIYREVHLVDIDPAALDFAANSQGVAGHRGLHLHGGVDMTGFGEGSSLWLASTSITPDDLNALSEWPADRLARSLPGGFDLVASTCLLSQLMESARHSLGADHPNLGSVERALRTGHLRLLARLAAPTGLVVLISEVTSSHFVPGLANLPRSELAGLLAKVVREGNHYRRTLPDDLTAAVQSDERLRGRVIRVATAAPWRWTLFERCYLVSAMTVRFGAVASWSG